METGVGDHRYITIGASIVLVKIVGVSTDKEGNKLYRIEQVVHSGVPSIVDGNALHKTTKEAAERSLHNMGIT
jgi:hypothetical protein